MSVLIDCISYAFSNLKSHRLRSFLTSAGLAIGIAVVIIILSVGNTVSDIIGVYYSDIEEGNYYSVSIVKNSSNINLNEASGVKITLEQCMKFNSSDFPDDIYGIDIRSSLNYEGEAYLNDRKVSDIVFNGVSPAFEHIKQLYIESGRFITAEDCDEKKKSVVIAKTLAEKLYGSSKAALTKEVNLKSSNGVMFTGYIAGVYAVTEVSDKSLDSTDVFCAYSLINELFSAATYESFDTIKIACKEKNKLKASSINYINNFFDSYINVNDYITIVTPAVTQQQSMENVIKLVTAIFTFISMIIFIVSGIGLMNTLLISVTQCTSEIGIRKALGATDNVIIIQFLSEAFLLTAAGILGGLAVGFITNYFIQTNLEDILLNAMDEKYIYIIKNTAFEVKPPVSAVVFSILISLAIGLFFGVQPAKNAASMQPVDALRAE